MIENKADNVRGQWWLPSDPKRRISGEFQLQETRASLSLHGQLSPLGHGLGLSTFSVWGASSDGTPVTLLDCFVKTSTSHMPSGFSTMEISSDRWIRGGHFHSLDDVTLTELRCDLNCLVHWVGSSSYSEHLGPGSQTLRAESTRPKVIACASIDGVEIQFVPRLRVAHTDVSVTFRNTCQLVLYAKTPRNYGLLDYLLTGMAQLIALAAQEPVYSSKLEGRRSQHDYGAQETVEIFRRGSVLPDADGTRRRYQMLFTWHDIQGLGTDFFQKFFARRAQFRPSLEVLLGDLYNAKAYTHQRFLGLAHGLEAFHRIFVGGKYQNDEDFRENLMKTLAQAIPESLSRDFRSSLKNKLKYLNEYSLRKRITDLACRFDPYLNELIGDAKEFAKTVADRRNQLSHPDQSSSSDDSCSRDLWLMAEQMSLLLEVCLVRELGFGESVLQTIITDGRYAQSIRLNRRDTGATASGPRAAMPS